MNGASVPPRAEPKPDTQAIELSLSDRERALVASVTKRIEAIMSSPHAGGACAELAKHLAFHTDQPTDVVLNILKVAAAGSAQPVDDKWERFFQGKLS